MIKNREERQRRIIFRACHRAILELDLLIGRFARQNIADMSAEELDEFERILQYPDTDLYSWICGRAAVPAQYISPLLGRLIDDSTQSFTTYKANDE